MQPGDLQLPGLTAGQHTRQLNAPRRLGSSQAEAPAAAATAALRRPPRFRLGLPPGARPQRLLKLRTGVDMQTYR